MPPIDPLVELDSGAERRGFWARLIAWLQPWKRAPADDPSEQMLEAGPSESRTAGEMSWPRRRASQLTRLEEGFDRLVRLVDTIDQHIQKQAERSEQMVAQTRRIADVAGQAQALDRQRTEAMEELTGQYRTQTRQMQQVAEAVEALPRVMKQQSDQLGQIRDQLEAQLEAQLSTAQGVRQLAGAADVIRSVADEQRKQFQQMHEAARAANMQIVAALERQNRRFTWLMAFVLTMTVLAAAGSATVIVLLATRFSGR